MKKLLFLLFLTGLVNKASAEIQPGGVGVSSTFPSGINGKTDGSSAGSGVIGQVITSTITTSTPASATNTYLALTSLSLTAGDWDIHWSVTYIKNGATLTGTDPDIAISTTTASAAGTISEYSNVDFARPENTVTTVSGVIKASISSPTPYFLNVRAQFSAGTPQWRGFLEARRIR